MQALLLFLISAGPVLADSFNEAEWRDRLSSDDPAIAGQAIGQMEPLTRDQKRRVALALAAALSGEAASARKAAGAFSRMGPAAEAAAPALVDALRSDDAVLVPVVADALVKMGAGAVPSLQKGLSDPNFFVRQRSAEILGRLGPPVKKAARSLTFLLKDTYPEVRAAAENTLVQWGADAVPALAEALQVEEEANRKTIIQALGKCGPAAASPLLAELRREENVFLRAAAAEALAQIQPAPAGRVPALIQALRDLDEGVRAAAADALGRLAQEAQAAVGPLAFVAREDKEALVRQKAAQALEDIKSAGLPAATQE